MLSKKFTDVTTFSTPILSQVYAGVSQKVPHIEYHKKFNIEAGRTKLSSIKQDIKGKHKIQIMPLFLAMLFFWKITIFNKSVIC
jgi:phage-related protein